MNASQYEFFGQSLEEVELGGIDDDAAVLGHADDDGYHLFDKREGASLGSLSDMDDLATTFAKEQAKLSAYRDKRFSGTQDEFEEALRTSSTVYIGNVSFTQLKNRFTSFSREQERLKR